MSEKNLNEYLAPSEDAHSLWGIPLHPAGCPQCRNSFLVQENSTGLRCPICSLATLEAQPVLSRREPPELLVPFTKARNEIASILSAFVKTVWLAPDDFTQDTLLQRAQPVYWPMWMVDCNVDGSWEAEMGYDYEVQSSRELLQGGTWKTQSLVETRANWEKRCGTISRHYDNIVANALESRSGIAPLVGSYDYKQSLPYQAEKLANCQVVLPDIHPDNAWPMAEQSLRTAGAADCMKAASAQNQREFSWNITCTEQNWTLLLLPLFSTYYSDDEGHHKTILINGQTGQIGGVRMASEKRGRRKAAWSAGVAVTLILLGLLSFALAPLAPPLSILGILMILAGFGAVIYALILAIWPMQWNKRQQQRT